MDVEVGWLSAGSTFKVPDLVGGKIWGLLAVMMVNLEVV